MPDTVARQDHPTQLYWSLTADPETIDTGRALAEEERSSVLLVDIKDLSPEEAAKIFDQPIGTSRARLWWPTQRLQRALTLYGRDKTEGRPSSIRESSPTSSSSSEIKD